LLGFGNIAGDLSDIFVFCTGDLARVGVRAAFGFRRASLADLFQGTIAGSTLAGRTSVRVRVIAAKLLKRVTFGADALVVLCVPFEVGAGLGSV